MKFKLIAVCLALTIIGTSGSATVVSSPAYSQVNVTSSGGNNDGAFLVALAAMVAFVFFTQSAANNAETDEE